MEPTPAFSAAHHAERLRRVLSPLYRGALRLRVEGEERIPLTGPCILAFNHLSNLDPHLLFTLVRRPDATGLVASEYRAHPLARRLVEAGGGMWLRRGAGDRGTLRQALALLEAGWLVGLAPEGGRSREGALRRARPGVGFLALRSGAPVLPVAVRGTEQAVAGWLRLQRAEVEVRVGDPVRFERGAGAFRVRAAEVSDEVMGRIAALLPPAYRGVYRGVDR